MVVCILRISSHSESRFQFSHTGVYNGRFCRQNDTNRRSLAKFRQLDLCYDHCRPVDALVTSLGVKMHIQGARDLARDRRGINCDGSSESQQGSGCVYYTYEVTGLFYPNAKRWCQQFVMNDAEHIKNRVRAAPPWRPCVLREAFRRHSKIKQNITHCRVIQFRTPCRYVSNLEHL